MKSSITWGLNIWALWLLNPLLLLIWRQTLIKCCIDPSGKEIAMAKCPKICGPPMGYSPVYTASNPILHQWSTFSTMRTLHLSTIQSPPESSDNLWHSFVVWQERDNASCHTPDPSTELLAALIPLKTIDTSPIAWFLNNKVKLLYSQESADWNHGNWNPKP